MKIKKEKKKKRTIAMSITEYNKLKRTRRILVEAKNNIRLAWEKVSSIKE